jgi:hypothetical protein
LRKGFTRKPPGDEPATPGKNYIRRGGLEHLKDEDRFLFTRERPAVTEAVAWATGNGDRSENADYPYGERRLRQIEGRIRFLTKRIEAAGGRALLAGRFYRCPDRRCDSWPTAMRPLPVPALPHMEVLLAVQNRHLCRYYLMSWWQTARCSRHRRSCLTLARPKAVSPALGGRS